MDELIHKSASNQYPPQMPARYAKDEYGRVIIDKIIHYWDFIPIYKENVNKALYPGPDEFYKEIKPGEKFDPIKHIEVMEELVKETFGKDVFKKILIFYKGETIKPKQL